MQATNKRVRKDSVSGVAGVGLTRYGTYKVVVYGKYRGTYKTMNQAKEAAKLIRSSELCQQ